MDHMEVIPPQEIDIGTPTYYIPHHSVLKESSTTTKLRVVFDASAPTSNGLSLNDTLQDNITSIMMRFRLFKIAFTTDVAKMYRMIQVTREHQDLQRIVWRTHPSKPLRDYRLKTVTYGTTSAPYAAIKSFQQLAKDEQQRFPLASKVALRDQYVDDVASSCQSLETAMETVKQLQQLAMSGGFQYRKWVTNSPELLETIPSDLRETKDLIEVQEDSTVKTLGVFWNPSSDKYIFRLSLPPDMPGLYTKRIILSEISKIYDPLGWLAPAIIICKILMQTLWKVKHNWDEVLPQHIQDSWLTIKHSLRALEQLEIPRCMSPFPATSYTLVGCGDASTKALSACVYLLINHESAPPSINLITFKTRVAPVKHVTLPRLELSAALLLSEIMKTFIEALGLRYEKIIAFTDSTITYHWISSDPLKWKIYVRNRVQTIQANLPSAEWKHIPGERNPADCASRGVTAAELVQHTLWWHGDYDLFTQASNTAELLEEEKSNMESELQTVKVHHVRSTPMHPLFQKYSSFGKLNRVMAYIMRFINNWGRRKAQAPIFLGFLTVHELITARNFIFRVLQKRYFSLEYAALSNGSLISTASSIIRLQPFLSSDGLLRVGGRLRNSSLSFDTKHPILLPKSHHVTTSLINDIHRFLLHAGPTSTLSTFQQRFWVTNGQDTVRYALKRCVVCSRHRAEMMQQVMGDLPVHRITPAPPFSKVGIDYAGPILIRPMVRSKIQLKCRLSLFVCFVTRAVHIEIVSSLTTDCFMAALRRFISRRGKPSDIFSDCGTNFKGTDKVLQELYALSKDTAIQSECASQQITWHFNPAGAPHFGGLWESGIKSIKYHLKRVMGSSLLTYEEILTLIVQIEGILNSRPLVPASQDPSDFCALTPAHFLIGSSLTSFPEPYLVDKKETHLKRWQLIQQRQQIFWKRWSNEYVTRLQQRPKWWKRKPNLEVGNLVIIKDERLPPLKWKLGRVETVHPGSDGCVRVATIKTAEGRIKRPIVKLSLLPIETSV